MLIPERLNVIHRGRNPFLLSYRKRLYFKSLGRSITQLLKGWRPQVACPESCLSLSGQSVVNGISFEQQPKIHLARLSPYNARLKAFINLSFSGQCDA